MGPENLASVWRIASLSSHAWISAVHSNKWPPANPATRPEHAERDNLVSFLEALTGSDVNELVSDAFAAPIGDVH